MQNKNNKYEKHLHDRMMPRRVKVLAHKTDFGDFIQNIEPDYDNEYFYFDTRLRTYWGYLLQ
jgi:hypothetical protein